MSGFDSHSLVLPEQFSLLNGDLDRLVETPSTVEQMPDWMLARHELDAFEVPARAFQVIPEDLLQDGDEEVELTQFQHEVMIAAQRFYEPGALGCLLLAHRDEQGVLMFDEIDPGELNLAGLGEGAEMVIVDGGNTNTGESYIHTFYLKKEIGFKVNQ